MPSMKIDVAQLAGIACEGVVFGFFLSLSITSLYILTSRRKHSDTSLLMIIATVVMILLATAQFIVDTANIFMAFIDLNRVQRIEFMSDVTQPIFAAKHSIYFTQMLVGDMIVIYRSYIVWDRNVWVISLPSLCSLGSAICAYQTIYAVRQITTASIAAERSWGLAVFALSLAANSMATCLVAYRIWMHSRSMLEVMESRNSKRSSLFPIVWIVLESGFVNAAYLLAYIVILQSGTEALEIMACFSTPLIGIIFTVVIIRAALASEKKALYTSTSIPMTAFQTGNRHTDALVELRGQSALSTSGTGSFALRKDTEES